MVGSDVTFATSRLEYLKENFWIDRQSRALFVEFTIYNVNRNLFATVVLLAEILPTGGILPTAYISPFR